MAFLFYQRDEKNNQSSGLFSDYLSLMLGKPRISPNNLKISLRFPYLGLSPIIDSITCIYMQHKAAAKPA